MLGLGDFIGEARFSAVLRPARVAYLVASSSKEGMRRAIQEACTRWGGATEPIIAVSKSGAVAQWDRQVLEILNVDALVVVDVSSVASKKFARGVQLPMVELAHIDNESPSMWSSFPALISPTEIPNSFILPTDDSLWQATAIGSLTDEGVASYVEANIPFHVPFSDDEAGRAQLAGRTLIDITVDQFGEMSASNGPWPTPTVIWVAPRNGFEDCRMYWNVRALRSRTFESQPMVLLPDTGFEHWADYYRDLGRLLQRPVDVEPDVIFGSLKVGQPRLREIARHLRLQRTTNAVRSTHSFPPPPRRAAPFTYRANVDVRRWFVFGREYGRRTETTARLFRSATEVEVESPIVHRQHGRTLLQLASSAFDSYPRRLPVANRIFKHAEWHDDSLQIATSLQNKYRFKLRLPSLEEALQLVLHERGVRFEPSEKGVLAQALLSGAGVSELSTPETFRAVVELTTPRSKELKAAAALARRRGDSLSAITEMISEFGGRTERRHRTLHQLRSAIPGLDPLRIERLVALEWIERGLVTRCSRCRIKSFVLFPLTDSVGACPACGSASGYLMDANGLQISYRLSAIVDRASDQGVLPQAMAASRLAAERGDSFLIPGANLSVPDGKKAEADVLGIFGRKVLVGEVKRSASQFTATEIRKDVKRAESVGADLLLLACPHAISPDVTRLAELLCSQRTIELRMLDLVSPDA